MGAEEIITAVRENKVTAPVGTKTFMVVCVGADGKLDMAGTADPNHAIQIAYMLMRNVFEPKGEKNEHTD